MNPTKEQFTEAINQVLARSATDMAFRQLCVSNIHAAIREESGIEVPAGLKISVLDQSANQMNVILPPVAREDGELLESELESVSGGCLPDIVGQAVFGTILVGALVVTLAVAHGQGEI